MHRLALTTALLLVVAFGGWAQGNRKPAPASERFYSEQQAKRGKDQYNQNCSKCHLDNLRGVGSAPPLVGDEFRQRWHSVGDLFSKTSMSMPGDNVHGLRTDTYVDIVAYLLQANGLPAGREGLPNDGSAMKRMVLISKGSAQPSNGKNFTGTKSSNDVADGFYSAEQAERGKAFFAGACSLCHTAERNEPLQMDPASGRGMWGGSRRYLLPLASDAIAEKYHSVGGLFNKIRTTMPAYDAGGLSPEEYVDIVAYLLRANGLPSGKKDLPNDSSAMKNMTLEKGFEGLFNGKDFTGFGFLLGNNCAPRPSGCGQTEPGSTFRIEKGTIVCSGKPQGYMYTGKSYLNFTLRLEYRYQRQEGMESDEDFYGNSGYLLFIRKHQVWPKMIEIQGRNSAVLSVIAGDSKATYTVDDEARKRALKPVGQWNAVEIVSKDGQIRSSLNGTLLSIISEHEFKEPGQIGFQSEGAEIHWRNIRIRDE